MVSYSHLPKDILRIIVVPHIRVPDLILISVFTENCNKIIKHSETLCYLHLKRPTFPLILKPALLLETDYTHPI